MRLLLLTLISLTTCTFSFCQDSIRIITPDTVLPFSGSTSLNRGGYENRVVPYSDKAPLYVLISYEKSKAKHFEYFRIDSLNYLFYEFFRSGKDSGNEGLKKRGLLRVIDKITDSAATHGVSGSGNGGTRQTHYYKTFSREGEWEEYEDSLFDHKFWKGKYENNKKVGMWSNYIYQFGEDQLIMQIDYDKDSTLKISRTNLADNLPSDSIFPMPDTTTRYEKDTSISFFGIRPIELYDYDNRVIPYNDPNPLYVCINYTGGKRKNIEYFMEDSTSYLAYEFFKNGQEKSSGIKRVRDSIIGISRSISKNNFYSTIGTHYYKQLSKEGMWKEYVDSFESDRTYWIGKYLNNKRIGVWRHVVETGGNLVVEEIDYNIDNTLKIYKQNLALSTSLKVFTTKLNGYWNLLSCDEEKQPRMTFLRATEYPNAEPGVQYYNERELNHYEFKKGGLFQRGRGDGCYKFRETSLKGRWSVIKKQDFPIVEIKFDNGRNWKLKILYLDEKGNLVTERI